MSSRENTQYQIHYITMRYNMQKSNKSTEKRFYKTLKTTATAVNRGPDEILTGTTKAWDSAMMVCRMCPVFKRVCRLKCRNCSPGAILCPLQSCGINVMMRDITENSPTCHNFMSLKCSTK